MKKFIVIAGLVFITNVANAKLESYASVKMGIGDTTIYVDGDKTIGDWFIEISESNTGMSGFEYGDSGFLWELSPAIGIDWTPDNKYGMRNQYHWFHLRGEIEAGYNHYRENGKLTYNYAITDIATINFNQVFVLANGYADFKIEQFAPYIGFGIGYSFGTSDITIANAYGEFNDSVNDNGVIYALNLGLGVKYSDITTFDFGVRRVYVPTDDSGKYIFDTVRVGARFRI
ncbi:MAG: hypothetical protein J6W41_03335 [Alphaproteobacteria bacterium]|nr:hypothetical protein [Alphaproteobacteria bacterium]